MKGVAKISAVALLLAGLSLSGAATAQNEQPDDSAGSTSGPAAPEEPVEAVGVGIAGGVLLGAELVLSVEAIIGVDSTWPWIVFPILGAGGGGVGGYFVEQASPEGAVAMLVVGLAAIIPTAVAVSVSNAYDPEAEGAVVDASTGTGAYSFEMAPTDEADAGGTTTEVESRPEGLPEDAPPLPGAGESAPPGSATPPPSGGPEGNLGASERRKRAAHLASGSLLHFDDEMGFGFGVPALDVRPTQRTRESALLGAPQGVEFRVPVLEIDLP